MPSVGTALCIYLYSSVYTNPLNTNPSYLLDIVDLDRIGRLDIALLDAHLSVALLLLLCRLLDTQLPLDILFFEVRVFNEGLIKVGLEVRGVPRVRPELPFLCLQRDFWQVVTACSTCHHSSCSTAFIREHSVLLSILRLFLLDLTVPYKSELCLRSEAFNAKK